MMEEIKDNNLDFERYLEEKDRLYCVQMNKFDLFNPHFNWEVNQKKQFAAVFYHLRGRFIDFLWYMGNFTQDDTLRKIIIDNISEELGLGLPYSHEALYDRFAKACQVDIQKEIVEQTNYLPFAQKFNQAHLNWLANHDELERLAMFAAYEHLDNIDYLYLSKLAQAFQIPDEAALFFKVHLKVSHFSPMKEELIKKFKPFPSKIMAGFSFIYSHQLDMWNNLQNYLFQLKKA